MKAKFSPQPVPWTMDSAAYSLWIDEKLFREIGGTLLQSRISEFAVDEKPLQVFGEGAVYLCLWKAHFRTSVKMLSHLPSKVLIGRRSWFSCMLKLDVENDFRSISYNGKRLFWTSSTS